MAGEHILSKTCIKCSTVFSKPRHTSKKVWETRKYCSKNCRRNAPRACLICKKTFLVHGTRRITGRYCSYSCARKGQSNYKGGISRGQNTSNFSFGQRQRVRNRDNYQCQDCGSTEMLIIHHMTFTKDVLPDSLLVLLCRSCHHQRHYEHDILFLRPSCKEK
jgi:hypothetical protein